MVKSKMKTKINKGINKNKVSKNIKLLEVIPPLIQKKGRQTNNSLASAIGQIVIDTHDEGINIENKTTRGKHGSCISSTYCYGYTVGIEEEEQQIGMHKVLKVLKNHDDAWPFIDPVDEQYAPKYYSVVRFPMDLGTMEDKLENGSYKTISQFKRDFYLIIDNCKQYNGSENEYTEMVMNLREVFDRAVDRYLEPEQSSEDSLSMDFDIDINSSGYKNKMLPSPAIRHSLRHKHIQKLNKKLKISTKINKEVMSHQYYDNFSKEKAEVETKTLNIKGKKRKMKYKVDKIDRKAEESTAEQERKSVIIDADVMTSKRKKSNNDKIISKSKKLFVKQEINDELIKFNKKVKGEIQQKKQTRSTKELKENRNSKIDFKGDYESISIQKSNSRKIEKNKNKDINSSISRLKKNKIKDIICLEKSDPDDQIFSLFEKNEKNYKIKKRKLDSSNKFTKDKGNISKKKSKELLKNSVVRKTNSIKNIKFIKNSNKIEIKSFITNKDIESLDSLKDIISERRFDEQFKLVQEKKKKPSLKVNNMHEIVQKVPYNSNNTYQMCVNKLGNKRLKSKNVSREDINLDNSQNLDKNEPKKVKTSCSKYTKASDIGDPIIQALNQATEETLNDINKWLDDAPKLSEFSSYSDSPESHSLTTDSSRSTIAVTSATPIVTSTLSGMSTDISTHKRTTSIKIFGSQVAMRSKKVQRTIDRLQPGKSKGNLLYKKPILNESGSSNDIITYQLTADSHHTNQEINNEPKLSLGTVLKNVDSIQLICKNLVSSPNLLPNGDDDVEIVTKPSIFFGNIIEEKLLSSKKNTMITSKVAEFEKQLINEETQKPKSGTPNLSAWFKAFGVPKSKKKNEDKETKLFFNSAKEEDIPEISKLTRRRRRISTGGSNMSESASSFSPESPPSRTGRSPQHNQQFSSTLSLSASIEPQLRGAGFYQDALSAGSSPYNSPYYTTPPRYSAQLSSTPSPQNHSLSPAYVSSYNFDQSVISATPNLYSQLISQTSLKLSPQAQSPTFSQQSPKSCFPQKSPQNELHQKTHSALMISETQNKSPVYSQVSPRPPSSSYSFPSPQLSSYTRQTPSPYSQSDLDTVIMQSSSQPGSRFQISPRQLSNYSLSSQTPSPYSAQPSFQQQLLVYSPQSSPSYSQPSPTLYSHSSSQSLHQTSVSNKQQQIAQSSDNQLGEQIKHQSSQVLFTKNLESYTQNLSTTFTQSIKSTCVQLPIITIAKPTATKEKQFHQEENIECQTFLNQQIYQPVSNSQYSSTYMGKTIINSVKNKLISASSAKSITSSLINHDTQQLTQQKKFQQNQEQQTQMLNYQQNLTSHEYLYSNGFKTTPYQVSNVSCHSMYPGYFYTNIKGTISNSSSSNNLTPVKKRIYNEPSISVDPTTQRNSNQEQINFDSLIALARTQSDVSVDIPNHFNGTFANSLTDTVTLNSPYTQLQLGLAAAKDNQQFLGMSRGNGRNDSVIAYGMTTTVNQPEFDPNLLQSLQKSTINSSNTLSIPYRITEQIPVTIKTKKNRKNRQLNMNVDQQTNISNFSQCNSASNNSVALKQQGAGANIFNFATSANNSSSFYNKETSTSTATAAYAFLDDFRNPNLPSYYSIALCQHQKEQQQEVHQQQPSQHQQIHQPVIPVSDVVQQVCNKLSNHTRYRSYSGYPFLQSAQRPTPYRPSVSSYVTPHAANLGIDPTAYQQYLHSLYALQSPPHHRPAWL